MSHMSFLIMFRQEFYNLVKEEIMELCPIVRSAHRPKRR